MRRPLRIGTRGSPLALAQAQEVRRRLAAAHAALTAAEAIEIVIVRTTGDRVQDRPLADLGGKGLFTKEIEEALLAGAIDLAVHSMKDVPTFLPPGLAIGALLPREDPRDAFFARAAAGPAALPEGAVVGTSSPRRQAQLLALRPDLRIVPFRGNVETRLAKLAAGEADATVLAVAGLNRLGAAARVVRPLSPEEMLPAVAQGAIGIELRQDDEDSRQLVAAIDDAPTAIAVTAERAMLAALDGSCRTPIAGLAEPVPEGGLRLRGLLAELDGRRVHAVVQQGAAAEAAALGTAVGQELRALAGPAFFAA